MSHNSADLSTSTIPLTEKLVHIFGQEYSALYDREELRDLLYSQVWCSYRKHFTPIAISRGPTSDSGWGCMHRVGQMVVARALQKLLLPKDWIWHPSVTNTQIDEHTVCYYSILSLFEDNPQAPLSVHKITQHSGKPVGAQLSPDILGFTLQRLWHSSVDVRQFGWLQIVALNSAIVPVEDFRDLGRGQASHPMEQINRPSRGNAPWRPILAFVPCMLMSGTNQILRALLSTEQAIGFMGGYNSRALWILGYIEDESFLAFDPHVTQRTAVFTRYGGNAQSGAVLTQKDDLSFHTLHLHRPSLKSLEGHSGSLALLFPTEESLDAWQTHFSRAVFPLQEMSRCHVLSVMARTPLPCSMFLVSPMQLEMEQLGELDHFSVSTSESETEDEENSGARRENQNPLTNSMPASVPPVSASVHLQNRLLYNDWFGRLYRFSDQMRQMFQRDHSMSAPPSVTSSSGSPSSSTSRKKESDEVATPMRVQTGSRRMEPVEEPMTTLTPTARASTGSLIGYQVGN